MIIEFNKNVICLNIYVKNQHFLPLKASWTELLVVAKQKIKKIIIIKNEEWRKRK